MILVDSLHKYDSGLWCHMVSDTSLEELESFARELGLKPEWSQGDHYDLKPGMKFKAMSAGAVEVGSVELFKRMVKK